MALGRVYCFGPTFRAEKSKTRRHLTEFWMVEPEVAWATLDDVIELAEGLVVEVIGRVLDRRQRELKMLERDTTKLAKIARPFARIAYDDAAALLKEKGLPFEWGGDFGSPDETALSEHFDGPVAVTGYPAAIKAFYFKARADRPEISLSVDVLAPEGYGEIVGGSVRESDLDRLLENVAAHRLPLGPLEWYLDLRRYGAVPTAGFGLGLARTVSWICGLKHIREAIPFPRMLNRFYP
jgi:asparaginyl-tRNA synthetase